MSLLNRIGELADRLYERLPWVYWRHRYFSVLAALHYTAAELQSVAQDNVRLRAEEQIMAALYVKLKHEHDKIRFGSN